MSISLKTHKMLWSRSASRCAFPNCRTQLVESETDTDDEAIIGDEAHIVAKKEDGPRGVSDLTFEKRDKYQNLILLCKIHHKVIDDQPNKYTVEVLHQMKNDHIEWINKNLDTDIDRIKDEDIYATYIDKWNELGEIDNWKNWSSYVLGGGQPQISVVTLKNLTTLNEYLFSRIWPKRFEDLEFAFQNFRLILSDFITVFNKYKILLGEEENDENATYITEKVYKRLDEWNSEKYNYWAKKFDYHVDLVQDLMCELTRSANYLCMLIRKNISSSFRIKEGLLLVETGPDMFLRWQTIRLEYHTNDKNFIQYKGLEDFMTTREIRGYHFGKGVDKDYLNKPYI